MVTVASADAEDVVTVKTAVVAPPGIVTVAGTVAIAVLLLDSDTTAPPLGAAPVSVRVPVEEPPPETVPGFSATEAIDAAAGVMLRVALLLDSL